MLFKWNNERGRLYKFKFIELRIKKWYYIGMNYNMVSENLKLNLNSKSFKLLNNDEFECGQIHEIYGPNGIGKTNILWISLRLLNDKIDYK